MNNIEVYEIPAHLGEPPIPLDEQIRMGCNDWQAETTDGAVFFGRTREEALLQAQLWLTDK